LHPSTHSHTHPGHTGTLHTHHPGRLGLHPPETASTGETCTLLLHVRVVGVAGVVAVLAVAGHRARNLEKSS
jgi:hypothetical protein